MDLDRQMRNQIINQINKIKNRKERNQKRYKYQDEEVKKYFKNIQEQILIIRQ